MPAKEFICPDGSTISIPRCLSQCPHKERCMFLPTLRALANSLDRNLDKPSVTELIGGTRELYLKKTTSYAVNPMNQVFALHGTAIHSLQEAQTYGELLSEERLHDNITSGKFDLYGKILTDTEDTVLGDYKVTSSYKLMKALGYYKVDVPTGDVYKTGMRKGQPKYRKEWRTDGVKAVFEWAVQLNYYRMLLEKQGFKVSRMEIQAFCRDYGLQTASQRNITKPVYLIPIHRISNHWLRIYMSAKAERFCKALVNKKLPPPCNSRERWNGRKCTGYCDVANRCPYGLALKQKQEKEAV